MRLIRLKRYEFLKALTSFLIALGLFLILIAAELKYLEIGNIPRGFINNGNIFCCFAAGILALVRYYALKNNKFLFVGMGFISAGVLIAYQAISQYYFHLVVLKSWADSLSSLVWSLAGIILGVHLLFSWIIPRLATLLNIKEDVSDRVIYFFAWILLIGVFLFLVLIPQTWDMNIYNMVGHTFKSLPLTIYTLALLAYFYKGSWTKDVEWFDFFLVLSMIFFFFVALLNYLAQSVDDNYTLLAEILQLVGNICVMIGLLTSSYHLFRKEAANSIKLKKQYHELREAEKNIQFKNIELEYSLKALGQQNEALMKTKKELEGSLGLVEKSKRLIERKASDLKKYKMAVDNASDFVIIVGRDARMLFLNKSFKDYLDGAAEHVIGNNMSFIHSVILPEKTTIKEFEENFESKKIPFECQLNVKIPHQKNNPILEFNFNPVRNSDGQIAFFTGIGRDITRIREIDKAKTEFVALASHQFRTPLWTTKWLIEMLLEGDVGKVNKEQKNFLNDVHDANERMIDLVKNLLNISKIEMGTFDPDYEELNIIELVESIIKEQNVNIKTKAIKFETHYENNISSVILDSKFMTIIIQNLISNAVKYTPDKGNVKLEMEIEDKMLCITVSDSGYGIPKDQQKKIFSKLFRADNIKTKDTNGNGLGLYLVKSLIEKMHGKIWFESEEGKGTKFFVALPTNLKVDHKREEIEKAKLQKIKSNLKQSDEGTLNVKEINGLV